jgi:methylenetetrahydrofolate reductase (NADPH)
MSFQKKLESGERVLTAEITPPREGDPTEFIHVARELKPHFDALNVTDNQRALMRMSNLATAAMLVREGVEPIYQLTCRDRNSLALQADLLGAQALGVRNVLTLTGDPIKAGHFESAKAVFEFESVGLLRMIGRMKEGVDSAGKKLKSPLHVFPGAVVNPSVKNVAIQIKRMEKKIEAGAKFFQTQAVFDKSVFESFCRATEHLKVPVIVGVLLVRSLKSAQFLQDKVPGIFVPDELFKTLEKAENQEAAGIEYCGRLARELGQMCAGVHLMAIKDEIALIDVIKNGRLKEI